MRAGGLPVDRKLLYNLSKHGPDLEDKSLTICSGTDYININYQHIVCPDVQTAKVILTIFYNIVKPRKSIESTIVFFCSIKSTNLNKYN